MLDLLTGRLAGVDIVETRRTVGDLRDYWADPGAIEDEGALLYTTQSWFPEPDGTAGAVLFGNTTLMPGRVGGQPFMTRGHWHQKPSHGELVMTVSGTGEILLSEPVDPEAADGERKPLRTRSEPMYPGSVHYIDGRLAHRTINTGDAPLVFLCAWPGDCGHDYESILRHGFEAPQ